MGRSPGGFRFGPYQVDLRAGELRKHGLKIRLQEQPLRVLNALAHRPSELVTRRELKNELWPDDTFVDFEHGLNAAVHRLREALSDSAESPRYIETLPRRGYRFIAPVEPLDEDSDKGRRTMLAVLPFRSRGGDEDYFAEGMCDEMIAQLGRLAPDKLGVIAHTSTIRFKDTILPADQIGRELGVGFLLEGSVRRSAPRVRITARLVRVADQSQLWVENFDETIEDVLAIQIECAKRIARSLALELVPAHCDAMGRAATSNAPAYESYLRGRYFWNRRTADAFDKAVASFEDSIARAPDFALARVGLADVWNLAGLYSVAPPGIAGSKARLALDRALAIDDASAEAHVSLALNRFLYEWDWPGAEDAFRYGLDQNPNLAQGHYLYAFFLATMGRFDEAFRHADEARALDPVSLVISTHSGWVCYFARDYDRAIGAFGKAIEMDPTFAPASLFLGLAYLQKGDWGAAVETLRRAREWSGSHPGATSGLAIALTLDGREGEAQELFDSAESGARDAYVSPYYRALAALGMGRTEAALDLLESAFDERSPWLVCLAVEPAIDPLRSDPRCRKLLEGVGLTRAAGS